MGQRLVVNITSNGDILANAYYHWDAYTETAAEQTVSIVSHIESARKLARQLLFFNTNIPLEDPDRYKNLDKLTAYLILESTGAGIEKDDEEELNKIVENYNYRKGNNRNEGLIAITQKNIDESNYWAEGTVDIDISKNEVCFKVFAVFMKDELEENVKIKKIDFDDIECFKFSELEKWHKKILEICHDTTYPCYCDLSYPDIYYYVIA